MQEPPDPTEPEAFAIPSEIDDSLEGFVAVGWFWNGEFHYFEDRNDP